MIPDLPAPPAPAPPPEMPPQNTGNRLARGTAQMGLPAAVITLLSVFDVISWNELQTTAVLAASFEAIQVLMNVTSWGRRIFAPPS